MEKQFLGLAHICIFTGNLEKSVGFYTQNLGFIKVYETYVEKADGNVKYAIVKLDGCIIELLEPDDKKDLQLGKEGTIAHIAIEVRNLAEIVKELKINNLKFTTEIFALNRLLNGVEGAFIKGPSGELIELFEYKNEKPF